MLKSIKDALSKAGIAEFEDQQHVSTPPLAGKPGIASARYTAPVGYDPDMLSSLNKVIAARKTPYTALLETAAKLESVIPDENMRLKAAFATIAADGQRTLESIVQGIDIHLADIERERMSFKRNAATQLQAKAGSLRGEATRRTQAVEAAEKRLHDLHDEIVRITEQRSADITAAAAATAEADSAESEVRSVEQKFDHTADHLKSNLESRKQYLGSVLR